jgi:hypothetical protein
MPHFAVSSSFEFERLGSGFDYGLAQSLFTHLRTSDISLCLRCLHRAAATGCRFYATFFESNVVIENLELSDSAEGFRYTRAELEKIGIDASWEPQYIGNWGHPRGQQMMLYVKTMDPV